MVEGRVSRGTEFVDDGDMASERSVEVGWSNVEDREGVRGGRDAFREDNLRVEKTGAERRVREVREKRPEYRGTAREGMGAQYRRLSQTYSERRRGDRGTRRERGRCYFCEKEAIWEAQIVGGRQDGVVRILCAFAASAWRECYPHDVIRPVGKEVLREQLDADPLGRREGAPTQ